MRHVNAWAVSLFAVIALLVSACSANGGPGSSGPVNLKFWYTQGQNDAAPILKIVSDFNANHADIHVTAQAVDLGSAHDQFAAAAKSGVNAPDVVRVDAAWIAEFANANYLLDLTSRAGNTQDFVQPALANVTYQGKIWALPETVEFPVLYYNTALLSGAGISQPPANMDGLVADAAKASQGNVGQYGFATEGTTLFVTPFLLADGGDLVSGDGKTPLVNNPQSISGFNRLLTMIQANSVLPFNAQSGFADAENNFESGKVAMLIDGSWDAAALMQGAAFQGPNQSNFGIAPIPQGTGGDIPRSLAGGESYAVYRGSSHPDAAVTFLNYLDAAEQQSAVAQANATLPARQSAYTANVLQNKLTQSFYGMLSTAKARPAVSGTSQLFATFDKDIQGALTGNGTAQSALNQVAQDWQPLLSNG